MFKAVAQTFLQSPKIPQMPSEREEGVFRARTSVWGEWDFLHTKSLLWQRSSLRPTSASAGDQGVLASGYPVEQLFCYRGGAKMREL